MAVKDEHKERRAELYAELARLIETEIEARLADARRPSLAIIDRVIGREMSAWDQQVVVRVRRSLHRRHPGLPEE